MPDKKVLKDIQAFLLDIFFGFYIAILSERILLHAVILGDTPEPMTTGKLWGFLMFGLVFAGITHFTKTSLSLKIFGRGAEKNSLKNAVAVNIAWILVTLSIVAGWVITKISLVEFFSSEGLQSAGRIFSALVHPEMSIFWDALGAIIETLYLALMATIIALPFCFVLSFLSARNLMKGSTLGLAVYTVIRVVNNFTRSIEPLIWAIIFSVWVGIGPFAGMLALAIHTVASLTKLYSEQVESIDAGPMEALEATGARPLQVIWFAVVPQIFLPFLSFTIYRWDINVRMATVIGLVGGGGIGTMLMQYQGLAQWNEVGLIVIMIAVVVWIMDEVSARVREALQ
jgi:phosphonate transport system permease protein